MNESRSGLMVRCLIWGVCVGLLLAAPSCDGCEGCRDPEFPTVRCASEPLSVSRYLDPCESGTVLVGPVRIDRTRATPHVTQIVFSAPSEGSYCLLVNNAEEESRRVTAAWINLDGVRVVGPDRFLRQVRTASAQGSMTAGNHTFEVRAASGPDRYFDVELRFAPVLSEATIAQAESLAFLEYRACRDTVSRLRLLSPDAVASLLDDAVAMGLAPGQLRVRFNAYGVPSHLSPLPAEEESPGSGADPRVIAEWWLERYRDLFRGEDPRISLDVIQGKDRGAAGSAVRFDEHVSGLRVDGARMEVQVDPQGNVRLVAGNFVPRLPGTLTPRIAASDAVAAAQAEVGCPTCRVLQPPALVVADLSLATGEARSVLAWRVRLAGTLEESASWVWVDAGNGAVVRHERAGFAAPDEAGRTLVALSDVGGPTPRAADVVFDGIGFSVPDRCATDYGSWCPDLLLWILALDLDWRVRFGRAGWSDDGLPPSGDFAGIAPDEPYRVLYDSQLGHLGAETIGNARERPGEAMYDIRPGGIDVVNHGIWLKGPTALSSDIVRHEFGHWFWTVEAAQRDVRELHSRHSLVFHEHVAEYGSLGSRVGRCEACDTCETCPECTACRERLAFSSEWADGSINLEYHGTGCEGPAWTGCPAGCREYSHLTCFDEEWFMAQWFDPDLDRTVPDKNPYWNQCILTKLGYLVRRGSSDEWVYHGVPTRPLPANLGAWLFHEHLTGDAGVLLTPDDYGYFFRLALGALRDKCDPLSLPWEAPREPAPDCSPTENEWALGTAALDSLGFWSEVHDLSGRLDAIRPTTPPAAAVGGGFIWIASIVGRNPDDPFSPRDLMVVRTDQSAPGMAPAAFNLTAAQPAWAPDARAASVTFHDRAVWIAYVGRTDGSTRFLHFPAGREDPAPVEGSPFVARLGLAGYPPALASCGGRLYVAYVDTATGLIMWASQDAGGPFPVDVSGAGSAYFPTLACVRPDGGEDLLILAYVTGSRWVGAENLGNLIGLRKLQPGETAWSEEQLAEAMTSRRGWHAARSWRAMRTWGPEAGRPWIEPGIGIALQHGRLQFVFPAADGEIAGDQLRHMTADLAPRDSGDVVVPMTAGRATWLPALTQERAAVVTAADESGATRVHVFWTRWEGEGVLQPYRLQSLSKRSD